MVTHPNANPSSGCLTREIERDRVHSTEYGRILMVVKIVPLYIAMWDDIPLQYVVLYKIAKDYSQIA